MARACFSPRCSASIDVECDRKMESRALPWAELCALPENLPCRCGRALGSRLGIVRPIPLAPRLCATHRARRLLIREPDTEKQKELLRSEDSFNLWQSILRGAGVITGCRRCADVCPVGADYRGDAAGCARAHPGKHACQRGARRRHVAKRSRGRTATKLFGAARWIGAPAPTAGDGE